MADRRRTITLSVHDDFTRQLRSFVQQMDSAERSVGQFGDAAGGARGGFGQANQQLFFMVQNAQAVTRAFGQVFSTAGQWADLGEQATRSKIALEGVAGGAEQAATWIDAVRTATKNTVTEGEAAGMAFQLLRFGLADTAQDAETFVRAAAAVGAASPQISSTGEAIEQISLTISNMSYMRLDQLGISSGEVRARVAELKDEVKGLTTEQAFKTAVFEELTEQAELFGDEITEVGAARDRMEARWRGFKEWAGTEIAAGFDAIFVSAEGAAAAIDKVGWGSFQSEMQRQGAKTATEIITGFLYGAGRDLGLIDAAPGGLVAYGQTGGIGPTTAGSMNARYMASLEMQAAQMQGQYGRRGDPLAGATFLRGQYGRGGDPMASMSQMMGTGAWGGRSGYPDPYIAQYQASQMMRDRNAQMRSDIRSSLFDRQFQYGVMGTQSLPYGQAQGAMQGIAPILEGITGLAQDAMTAAGAFREMAEQAEKFTSLTDKYGIAADAFDVDVYTRMKGALTDAGTETEAAAEAMQRYELATGMTNAQMLVFDEKLANITSSFTDGQMSAQQYADAVMQLGQADFTWVDKVAQGMIDKGDMNAALEYIERVSGLDNYGGAQGAVQGADKWLAGVGLAGGEGEQSRLEQLTDEAQREADIYAGHLQTLSTDVAGWFDDTKMQSNEDLIAIEDQLIDITKGDYQVTLKINPEWASSWGGFGSEGMAMPTAGQWASGVGLNATQTIVVEVDGAELARTQTERNNRNNQTGGYQTPTSGGKAQ